MPSAICNVHFAVKEIALGLLIVLALSSNVQPQTPFYQGKTIRVIVGYLPGDNHDIWARLYARLMGKHIPGNPDFVVQNMPGAGSMIAARLNLVALARKPKTTES